MPQDITGVAADAAFASPIEMPANGDAVDIAQYWQDAIQQLCDREAYLYERFGNIANVSGDWTYVDSGGLPDLIQKTVAFPLYANHVNGLWEGDGNGGFRSLANSALICFDLRLPKGAIPENVRAIIDPGVARSGTNRMRMRTVKKTVDYATPNVTFATLQDNRDDTTNAKQVINGGFVGATAVTDTETYAVWFNAGNTGGTDNDLIQSLEIRFYDPGARND